MQAGGCKATSIVHVTISLFSMRARNVLGLEPRLNGLQYEALEPAIKTAAARHTMLF